MRASALAIALLPAAAAGAACANRPYDYSEYLVHVPRSILVLPPLGDTPLPGDPYAYLSTVTEPIVERGYYVLPVALVDAALREEGCRDPGEMRRVEPARLRELFGCDAILYVDLLAWGRMYQVLDTRAEVYLDARLVDAATGGMLWEGHGGIVESTCGGHQNGFGALLTAALAELFWTRDGHLRGLASTANRLAFLDPDRGLLPGPLHPDFERELARIRERRSEPDAPAAGEDEPPP